MDQPIRVLIADDHPKSRKGLRALLATCSGIRVVCEAENGRQAAEMMADCRPDVVLMDIHMPVWDGIEATQYIKARWPEVKVIALTIRTSWREVALAAGADVFLTKGCPSEDLLAAIQVQGDAPGQKRAVQAGAPGEGSGTQEEKAQAMRLVAGKALAAA
jgi:DNA-binding NarL/FixJ family response regulator